MSIRPLVLTASLCTLLLTSFALAQDPPAPPAAPPAPAAAGDKCKLTVNLQKDQVIGLDIKFKLEQTSPTVGDLTIDVNSDQTITVQSVDENRTATVRTKVGRIHGEFTHSMLGTIPFDSEKEPDADNPMAAQIGKQFTSGAGRETTAKMAADGSVEGEGGGTGKLQVGGLAKLPDRALGVGDSWEEELDGKIPSIPSKMKVTNTVKAVDADSVTVTHAGTVTVKSDLVKLNSSKVSGTTRISRKDGFVMSAAMAIEMDLHKDADPNATNPQEAMDYDAVVKLTTSQERKAVAATPEKKPEPAPAKPADGEMK